MKLPGATWGAFGLALVLTLSWGASDAAELRTVDLAISSETGPLHLDPLSFGEITLTVTNRGPDRASFVTAESSYYDAGVPQQQLELYPSSQTSPCTFVYQHLDPMPGNPTRYWILLWFGEMLPGTSRTCSLSVRALSAATGSHPLTFKVYDGQWYPSSLVTDPDPSNNATVVDISFLGAATAAVPIPTTGWQTTLALLLLVGAGAAAIHLRRDGFHGRGREIASPIQMPVRDSNP